MTRLKCLGIGCSPRAKGNTSILLERAMDGALAQGAECETIYLRDFKFSPCIACDACMLDGECALKDDMQLIYAKLLHADRLILAAPIYSMGINAMGKALIDRGQRFWSTKYILHSEVAPREAGPERRAIFLSASGTDLPGVFDCAVRNVRYYFKMLDFVYSGQHCFSKVDRKGEILAKPGALDEVFAAGNELISI